MSQFIWNEESHFLTVIPPEDGPEKQANIIAVVDVSFSMDDTVTYKKDGADVETAYTVLDLVKYSLKVITKSMSDDDTFGLVTFSDNAKTVMAPSAVGTINDMEEKIDRMTVCGSTNLWAGVKEAIELAGDTNSTIMVFTDGVPNMHPPRGYDRAYAHTRLAGGGSVHVFGFGMNLDVEVLFTMSQRYNGTYNYISDSSMIGTTFCYTIANIKSEVTDTIILVDQQSSVGQLCYGQPRHVMLPERPREIAFSDGTVYHNIVDGPVEDYLFHSTRYQIGEMLLNIVNKCTNSRINDMDYVEEQFAKIKVLADNVFDLSEDVNGELRQAIDNMDLWGRYYIPALFCCHERERANNFMDKGTQRYTKGPVFARFIKRAEEAFATLPPQVATGVLRSTNTTLPVANMASAFMCAANGCVSGDTPVLTKDRLYVNISDIKVGDKLAGQGWSDNTVVAVVRGPGAYMLNLTKGLHITEWHPIDNGEGWEFPRASLDWPGSVSTHYYFNTWNLVTTAGKFKTTNQRWVIALGHGVSGDPVASHPYLGSMAVVDDVKRHFNESTGYCEINGYKRDPDTGLINGVYDKV